jgi:hypothetical protein
MSAVAAPVSRVERALAGWLVEQPVQVQRLPVAVLSDEQAAAEFGGRPRSGARTCAATRPRRTA